MNPQESIELMHFIQAIRDHFDLTILLIEHDMKVVMGVCQYIWVMEYGAAYRTRRPGRHSQQSRGHPGLSGRGRGVAMLKIRDLYVRYGGIEAVQGVSLDIKRGSIVTLVGANGAGKSSIIRSIAGLNKNIERRDLADPQGRRRTCLPHRPQARGDGAAGHLAFAGRPSHPASSDRGGEPAPGRLYRVPTRMASTRTSSCVYSVVPPPEGTPLAEGRHAFGRRTADAGRGPRAHEPPGHDHARRALAGSGPAAGQGDLQHHPPHQRGRHDRAAGGAERVRGSFRGPLRLHPRSGPRGRWRAPARNCWRTPRSRKPIWAASSGIIDMQGRGCFRKGRPSFFYAWRQGSTDSVASAFVPVITQGLRLLSGGPSDITVRKRRMQDRLPSGRGTGPCCSPDVFGGAGDVRNPS